MLIVTERWERILEREARIPLEARLPDVLKTRRWFAGKARAIRSVRIIESVPIPDRSSAVVLLFIRVEYVDGAPEMYTLPLTAAFGERAAQIQQDLPGTIVATLKVRTKDCEQNRSIVRCALEPRLFEDAAVCHRERRPIHRRDWHPDRIPHAGIWRSDTRRGLPGPCGLESGAE